MLLCVSWCKTQFALRFWPSLLTLVMLVGLLALGTWQVQRLHWKENLLATIQQRQNLLPVDLDTALKEPNADYLPVHVSGIFQHDHEFYVNAISMQGEGGYYIVTPLLLEDGRSILVNRGWIPYDKKSPSTRQDSQLVGSVLVKGVLRRPQHSWLQSTNDPDHNIWYGVDLEAMALKAQVTSFLPYALYADASAHPGGYPLGGQVHVDLPNNHLVYAFTWYALALCLVVLYLIDARVKR